MIRIDSRLLRQIERDAERRYPEECCGLLVGRRLPGGFIEITQAHPSTNIAASERQVRFEVEPALRFKLMRALAASAETIVGHYHSHPDRSAAPSPYDRAMAFEPDLVWMITAVLAGRTTRTAAFCIEKSGVRPLDLAVYDSGSGEI